MFIYMILNTVNEKVYIGQTRKDDARGRKRSHLSYLRKNIHQNNHLQSAWNKYGEGSFVFSVVVQANSLEQLDDLERIWISIYDATNHQFGYNKETGGNAYKEVSAETREKIRRGNLGKKLSEETKAKLSITSGGKNNPMYGKCGPLAPSYGKTGELSPNFGKKHPPEFGQAISIRNSGKNHPLYGIAMPEETKQKISEAKKGKPSWNKSIPKTEEEKRKISESKTGKKIKPFTEEHKAKMRESALKREQKKRELKAQQVTNEASNV